jgi:hypothetical protein
MQMNPSEVGTLESPRLHGPSGFDTGSFDVAPGEEMEQADFVYRYALSAPDDDSREHVFAQLRAAHDYKRFLILVERGRRAAIRGLYSAAVPAETRAMELAEKKALDAATAVREKRAKGKTIRVDTTARNEARARAKEARTRLFAARKLARERLELSFSGIDIAAKELKKQARAYTTAYWGSYLLVEDAVTRMARAPIYEPDGITPSDPWLPWPEWDGTGSLGVQLQGGLTGIIAMGGTDTRLRIEAPAPSAWYPNDRPGEARRPGEGHRRKCRELARNSKVHLRIGSDGRAPIWGSWEADMHRALPAKALIKWAIVHRVKNGPFYSWHLCVTLSLSRAVVEHTDDASAVAIDLGWRLIEVGAAKVGSKVKGAKEAKVIDIDIHEKKLKAIRVCRWVGSDGARGELQLSPEDLRVLHAPEAIQSERGQRLERVRARLNLWCKTGLWLPKAPDTDDEDKGEGSSKGGGSKDGKKSKAARNAAARNVTARNAESSTSLSKEKVEAILKKYQLTPPKLPEWLFDAASRLPAWRAPGKFVRLLRTWAERRFAGDELPFAALQAYCAEDLFEWRTESNWRRSALDRRRVKYRMFAASLAKGYEILVLEQFDLRRVAVMPEDTAENETARGNRVVAAPSELRSALIVGFSTRSRLGVVVSSVNTTRICNACGLVEAFDAAADIVRRCGGCGKVQDQDDSAGDVLLARWRDRPDDAKVLVGSRVGDNARKKNEVKEGRWDRARRLAKEKEEKLAAARKGTDEGTE